MYSFALPEMMSEYKLTNLTESVDTVSILIQHAEVNRPALQLAGFYDYFDSSRIQVLGMVEYTFLEKMEQSERESRLKKLFEHKIPCVVLCRGLKPFPEMFGYAEEYHVPILGSEGSTSDFIGDVIRWMKVKLAPRVTLHGVLVDVYGEGVLIMGESGIGKSETALELIKRGHRFVADDAVEIKRVSNQTLIGSCPEVLRYFIELRGIGIIDVQQMFGVESIKAIQNIDLIINMENWDKAREYDRLGLREEFMDILGINIVCHSIPIRPGRNLSIICEAAAINHRQKKMGYNAARVLFDKVHENITK